MAYYSNNFMHYLVAMKSPARQLLIDLLVCAKQAKTDVFYAAQYGLTNDYVFVNLTMKPDSFHCHLLNYLSI